MIVAKSVKSASGKVVVFVNDERGRNSVSVFEKNCSDPVLKIEEIDRGQSLNLINKLSMV
jgi:hypothetical protein